jgi:hypothetical protein
MFDTFKKGSGGTYKFDNGQFVKISDTTSGDPNFGLNGPVYCPDGGYYDMALDKKFESKSEKKEYMRKHGLMMHSGSKKQTEGNPGKTYYFIPGARQNPRYYKTR